MRHYTLEYIKKLVDAKPKLAVGPERRPDPMPGKRYPTRVAWYMQLAKHKPVPACEKYPQGIKFIEQRSLQYIGKPNRYRALQARNFLQQAKHGLCIVQMWQAEWDKSGLVAWRASSFTSSEQAQVSGAFAAYHPHSPKPEIVDAFIKPVHVKLIGGMRLYSLKKKLAQEAVDAYYEWYYKQFKRKLRRPKAVAAQASTAPQVQVPVVPQEGNVEG